MTEHVGISTPRDAKTCKQDCDGILSFAIFDSFLTLMMISDHLDYIVKNICYQNILQK